PCDRRQTDSSRWQGSASGGQPASRSWSATRAALAGYHHRRGDDGGREGVGSRVLASLESEVESVATWAGVVRMVALRRPVQVSFDRRRTRDTCNHSHDPKLRSGAGGEGLGSVVDQSHPPIMPPSRFLSTL